MDGKADSPGETKKEKRGGLTGALGENASQLQ